MIRQDYARKKRTIEIDDLRTFARIEEREDGGPIIDLITGREPHVVGTKVCIKAGMRALPWESNEAERPMIELCETASPVRAMLSQPHELFMKVTGEPREWMYRPDLRLTVDVVFAEAVVNAVPFADAVCSWRPTEGQLATKTLIVEVKRDDDPRFDDPIYLRKLELARQVYERIGWAFVWVTSSVDILHAASARSVREVMLDHDVSLAPSDITVARRVLGAERKATLGELVNALGSLGKCCALHVRRIICMDMRNDLRPDTAVVGMPPSMSIFEMSRGQLW